MVEALKCIQHFILFAPNLLEIRLLVPFLSRQLSTIPGGNSSLKHKAAVTCIYQLVQRDPESVWTASDGYGLEEILFSLLDFEADPSIQLEIKDILQALFQFTVPRIPSRWISLCKDIIAKGGAADNSAIASAKAATDLGGDDVADGAGAVIEDNPVLQFTFIYRWRTQVFAVSCLLDMFHLLEDSGTIQHFDLKAARYFNSGSDFMVLRLVDIIRTAFNAATSHIVDLQLMGLRLLLKVITVFAEYDDPDLPGHSLLEQYQVLNPCNND